MRPGYKQTELGAIPLEWEVPFLRQHLLRDATYGVVKAGTFQRTGIPMLRGGDIKNGSIAEDQPFITAEKSQEYARTVLREHDVVIALVGYPGETAVVPKRLVGANISRAVGLLRPAKTLLPEFLACYLNSPNGRKEFLRPSAGSAQIVVNLSALNRLRLPLPLITEQRAIATTLVDVDALLRGLDRLVAKKRDLKQAAIEQLLTGQTRLPGFSGKWATRRVSEAGDVLAGKALDVTGPGALRPYLRTKNVLDGRIDIEDVLEMPMTEIEFRTFRVEPGDVLLNEGQSLELVGRCSMYRGELPGRCAMQNQLLRFRARAGTSAGFAEHLFRHCQRAGVFATIATQTTSVAHLGSSRFSDLRLVWPSDVAEQDAIATVLSDMDAELAALEARRNKTHDLKQAVMQELLTGKTRLAPVEAAYV